MPASLIDNHQSFLPAAAILAARDKDVPTPQGARGAGRHRSSESQPGRTSQLARHRAAACQRGALYRPGLGIVAGAARAVPC